MPTIAILGTMDTKGDEHAFVAELIRQRGHLVLVIDVGTLGEPRLKPNISRAEVAAAYARVSDLDLSELPYYQAFGYWKLACILQGVFARYKGGATAGDQGSVDEFPRQVKLLAQKALETLEQ